ncbi:MAG: xylanase [Bacteroidota bacterium]|nr:xylanase [Bacteroidota bacterium]
MKKKKHFCNNRSHIDKVPGFLVVVSFTLTSLFIGMQVGTAQTIRTVEVSIDLKKTYQVIENFGASDAWSCQFVGSWPDSSKNKMADWLFSMDTLENGNPKGIGLSLWRFNLGGGSTQQGDASGIKDEWRRAESFLEKDDNYNWNRQQGQLWFLSAAKAHGVKKFLCFFNSPPYQLTRNEKTYANNGICNIEPSHYKWFAQYSATVLKHIAKTQGVDINYLSAVNEPQWNWSEGGQEGCPYTNQEISALIRAFYTVFRENKISTKLIIPECGQHQYLVSYRDKPLKGNQIMAFFSDSSNYFVGNLPTVEKVIASHGYFTSSPFSEALNIRKEIASKITEKKDLRYWQSEYSVLGDNAGEIKGSGRDTGMVTALYVAKTIYGDLVMGNATAWQWWLAISPYNYKDGLIYIDKNKKGGNFYDSKTLWALGNYSRFVRPGMQRVEAKLRNADSLLVSAYTDDKLHKLVVVVVNLSSEEDELLLNGGNNKAELLEKQWMLYTTSTTKCLAKSICQKGSAIKIPSQSIVTFETEYTSND